ncbi:MAG TPA: TIGR02757 family protein [Flavipsychrobacter sp.]|nr:TIGR02757 family protein [Flavipsychrobacter sp.]
MNQSLQHLLNEKVLLYNQPAFIPGDPVCVPHRFSKRQDIEIAGFFAAILAWGNRTTIINNAGKLMHWMNDAPHDFIVNHSDNDLKPFIHFVHRTFNATDTLYFIHFLKYHYLLYDSLEDAFVPSGEYSDENVRRALIHFHDYFFSIEHPARTQKHIATPLKNAACKRINMFLRWMVRADSQGVDFGLWKKIKPAQLICPLDVHVASVSHRLGLLPTGKADWKNAVLLTERLKEFNAADPTVYDYALFGIGMAERL